MSRPRLKGFQSETSAGAVKHNGTMGLKAGQLRSGQARTAEPATTMANELLTQTEAETQAAVESLTGGHEFDGFLGQGF
jgi:hypothetical protein